MTTEEKKYLTLKEIIETDTEEDLYIEDLGIYIKIRNPTNKDRIDAESEATKHPGWGRMDILEKSRHIGRYLALKMIVEPKITIEDYLKGNPNKTDLVLDAVATQYGEKIKALSAKSEEELKRFLDQAMAKGAGTSSPS